MQEIILFILTFLFTFIIYQLFVVNKAKSNKKKKNNKKELVEISYLIKKYKLDMNKVNYNQLLQIVALVSSFDIALVVSIISLFDNFILEVLVGFCSLFLIIFVSYHFIYIFYKKKGMILDE